MLEADNLECLRGDNRLFAGLGFTLAPGELIYLQGRNGAGKTSLLRMLIGLLPPESGDIRWQGESIGKQRDEYHAARFAGQDMDEDAALDALAQVGLAGREDLPCRYLSQGQKRRVALARLVVDRRPLWVLDEPFVALDVAAVDWLAQIISAHLQRGGMAIMTTHQAVEIPAGAVRELRIG